MAVNSDPPLEVLRKALEVARQVGDYRLAGDVAVSIALQLIKEKNFPLATRLLKVAREYYQRDKHPDALKHSRVRLMEAEGVMAWEKGQRKRAREILYRARRHALTSQPQLLYRVDQSLSTLLEKEHRLKESLDYAKEAYNAAAASGFNRDRAFGLLRLYELYYTLGQLKNAYLALEASLVVARRLQDVKLIDTIQKLRKKLLREYTPEESEEEKGREKGQSQAPHVSA